PDVALRRDNVGVPLPHVGRDVASVAVPRASVAAHPANSVARRPDAAARRSNVGAPLPHIGARRASVAARCAKVVARSTIVHAGAPIANAAREVVTVRPWSVAVDRAFVGAGVPNGTVELPNDSDDRALHA